VARREPICTPEQAFGKKPAKPHGSKVPEEIPKLLQLQAFATALARRRTNVWFT